MIRRRTVYADAVLRTRDGSEVPVVSDERLIEEIANVVPLLNFTGGVLEVIVGRAPTGLEHEMVTTTAVIQWKDRTDARAQREPAVIPVPPIEDPVHPSNTQGDGWTPVEQAQAARQAEQDEAHDELARAEVARTVDPDEEEDLSAIPAAAR